MKELKVQQYFGYDAEKEMKNGRVRRCRVLVTLYEGGVASVHLITDSSKKNLCDAKNRKEARKIYWNQRHKHIELDYDIVSDFG